MTTPNTPEPTQESLPRKLWAKFRALPTKTQVIAVVGTLGVLIAISAISEPDEDEETAESTASTSTTPASTTSAPDKTTDDTTTATDTTLPDPTTTEAPTTTSTTSTTTTTEPPPPATCNETADDDDFDSKKQDLYPDRTGVQDDDHEAVLGDCVRLSGYTTWALGTSRRDIFGDSHLAVEVKVRNRDDDTQRVSSHDFALQTPAGEILDPSFTTEDDELDAGFELAGGGETTGFVFFDVPPGDYFLIYEPDLFNDARGVWAVSG